MRLLPRQRRRCSETAGTSDKPLNPAIIHGYDMEKRVPQAAAELALTAYGDRAICRSPSTARAAAGVMRTEVRPLATIEGIPRSPRLQGESATTQGVVCCPSGIGIILRRACAGTGDTASCRTRRLLSRMG